MKLRTRLFLWVGIIFFLAFGVSLIFEIALTGKSLKDAEEGLRKQILHINEEKRETIEHYLHVGLSEDQAKIDSLLLRIARDPKLGALLFLDAKDLQLVAPAHSAYLFKNDHWIDFVQSTKEGKLTSLFIPIDFPMQTSHEVPVNDKFSWVVLDKDREMQHPFIGVRLSTATEEKTKNLSLLIDELVNVDLGLTVFFKPEALLDFKKKTQVTGEEQSGVNLLAFEAAVAEASEYLKKVKEKQGTRNWPQKEIQELSKGDVFSGRPFDEGIRCLQEEGERLNTHVIQLLQRSDQAIMLSALASLFPSQAFGSTPFDRMAPKGIARFPRGRHTGHSVLADEVFFNKKVLDDASYHKAYPGSKECEGIASSLVAIAPQNMDRVFIGNTLQLKGDSGNGYLTVAIDTEGFMEDLVLSEGQRAFLVHQCKVVSAFCENGVQIHNAKDEISFDPKMLKEKNGIIKWGGKDFYFLHMVPFKNLDLHFYLLQPEAKAFALVRSVTAGSREVLRTVSWNMRIIAVIALAAVLLLLHRVAKKITRPITQLASVTQAVAEGKLEGLELPQVSEARHDEIAILCESFSRMIKGLQEKEKVEGVLNKVVSPEIAEEIMKGQVSLGGEEKNITVLFADIRNFTQMSANKPPHEVIEMLNLCMTKISHVIDEFGGVIDKYVGDEVMALFGAPLEKEDSALQSVRAALKMVEVLREWNLEREKKGQQPVEMGIGIHTGVVLVGNMGAENRLNYTVIGSNVNLAARMCSAAKGMEILISKETLEQPHVKENIEEEQLPPTELKGFEESFILFRVKGGK